ncbi:hypothetical protein MRX96_050719 [Rhipicephalus microplus]
MATASFASFAAAPPAPPTYHWPLHPAALDPSYCRDRQYSCDTAPPFSPYGPGPMPRQEPASGAMRVQCHRCGGFGHISRNCATGRRMGPPVSASGASDRVTCKHSARETSGGRCCPGGHLRQCAPSSDHSRWQRAPYGRPYRVVDVQGPARYRLKCKLLRTARRSGGPSFWSQTQADVRVLRLASGWSQSTMSLKCQIEWAAGCRRQQFLCVPDLCRDVVLGRDFLTAVKEQPEAVDDFGDSLRCIFAESDATVCASVPEATAACNVIISGHSSDLDPRMKHILEEFSEIFTTTPGCTTLAEHRIDTGRQPTCSMQTATSEFQEAGHHGQLHSRPAGTEPHPP